MIPEYVYAVERTSYDINIIVAGCRNKIPFIIAFFKHVPVFGNIESDIPFQSFRTYKVGLYLKFYSRQGHEPHYADCVIRWRDTLETEEARIALAMDSGTEKDDEIFFYCDSLDDLKSLANKGREDFTVAGCLGFGIYEELLQTT